MTREIQLTKGFVALVDDEDYEKVSEFNWFAAVGYAARDFNHIPGKHRRVLMHRFILGLGYGDPREVDHINHNRADNRRSNLRVCLHEDNQRNQKAQVGKSSGFKGVYFRKDTYKWSAYIDFNWKRLWLGCFLTEEEAAKAYDRAALQHFGEFACTNEVLGLFDVR
jgi:hypothetical protein